MEYLSHCANPQMMLFDLWWINLLSEAVEKMKQIQWDKVASQSHAAKVRSEGGGGDGNVLQKRTMLGNELRQEIGY